MTVIDFVFHLGVIIYKKNKLDYIHKKVELNDLKDLEDSKIRDTTNPGFTVQYTLFGAVKITKDVDTSNYSYSGYGICFDSKSNFGIGKITNEQNVIIFGCDMSFSSHANNKANNIYVLGKDFVQGINGTTIYAEKLYKTNFTKKNKNSYDPCITIMMIVIYLLMVVKN